eukprot:TRINITY_DN393_c1_g2_i2.p2 TRINITY_DN393_c1_g2~~TRINITY_DN393_c1_g2_i2.p2  ORF type:complete len:454 (-),score=104.79 TRINITY_DN393_c1_g2_i2:1943-3223(-)
MTVRMSQFHSHVSLKPLIGAPFGAKFELKNGELERLTTSVDLVKSISTSSETSGQDNRNLNDSSTAQKLTADEIKKMKDSGESGAAIIQALVDSSSTFNNKTELSKEKYIKKKAKKHLKIVEVVKPTGFAICKAYHAKNPQKINGLRFDTLSQMLTYANAQANINLMIYEDCGGIIVGSAAERLGGHGNIISLRENGNIGLIKLFNLTDNERSTILDAHINTFYNLMSEKTSDAQVNSKTEKGQDVEMVNADEVPPTTTTTTTTTTTSEPSSTATTPRKAKSAVSHGKIKAIARDGVNSLIISTDKNPEYVLESLFPYLEPSGQIIVHSQYLQPLANCYQLLKSKSAGVNLMLRETFMREYQVLPNRTRPIYNTSGASGYLLTGIKIVSDFGKDRLAQYISMNDQKKSQSNEQSKEPKAKKPKTSK